MKVRLPNQQREMCNIWTRYVLLAVCLALNDLYKFGDKRLADVLQAIEDILTDYGKQSASSGKDAADLMQAELLTKRKLHIAISGKGKSPFGGQTPNGR